MPSIELFDTLASDPRIRALARSETPALLVDGHGDIVWRNGAAESVLGEDVDDSARSTLTRIGVSGAEGLVRLRLGTGPRRKALTFRSSRGRLDGERRAMLLEGVVAPGSGPADEPSARDVASEEGAAPQSPRPAPPAGEPNHLSARPFAPAPERPEPSDGSSDSPASPSVGADEDRPPDPREPVGFGEATPRPAPSAELVAEAADRPPAGPAAFDDLRFVFEIGADGRIAFLSPDLAAAVGPSAERALGRAWADVASELGLDPDGAVAAALAKRGGWSDLAIGWPTPDGGRLDLTLSALPMFDNGRSFLGFRGLGRAKEPPRAGSLAPDAASSAEASLVETPPAEAAGEAPPSLDGGGEAIDVATSRDVDRDIETDSPPLEAAAALRSSALDEEARETDASESPLSGDLAQDGDAAPGTSRRPERVERPFVQDRPASEPFKGNVVPLREPAPGRPASPMLSTSEESAFDEIARRLRGLGVRTASTLEGLIQDYPETAEISPVPRGDADWTIDDVEGRAPTASRVDDLMRLLDRLPLGVIVLCAGQIVYANRAALEMTGDAELSALADRGADTLFAEPLPRDDAAPATVRLVAGDGVEVEVQARLAAMPWLGAPATLVTLRRADGALAEARDALRREREITEILDTATDGVLILDGAGRILSVNRSAEALFGFEQRDAIGALFTLSLAPESRSAAFDYLDSLKSNGVASLMNDGREVLGLTRHGGAIPLSMTLGRVGPPENGRYCAVLRDVTPWKKAEEELLAAKRQAERANAQKSEFLARVSHEIRTPLNAIIGFAEVMMEERFGPVGSERYRDYLRDIHASGGHLVDLVNDLLDLARIESGRLKLDPVAVDLNEIVAQAAALLQPQANRDHVIIRTSLARNLPPVLADRRSVRQILTNLVSNAVKFSRPGGQVIVATAYTDLGQAVARVRDAGAGMSRRDLARALEPFRAQPPSPGSAGAGGVGLPLTKALAEANEATLTIDSQIGEGTLVEVVFPSNRVLAG
jgi:PAS domain S-box-containing protein